MNTLRWSLALGLVLSVTKILAQDIVTQTISVDTGSCAIPTGTGGLEWNGGPIAPSGVPSTIGTNYGTYKFAGFYALPATGNVLNGATTMSPTTTLESCASFCQGTAFFALEQGDECLCSTSAPSIATISNPSTLTPCAGSSKEICGSQGYGILYRNVQTTSGSTTIVSTASNSLGSTFTVTASGVSWTSVNTPGMYITDITGTDSLGSTIVRSSTVVSNEPLSYITDTSIAESLGSAIVETSTIASVPASSVLQPAGFSSETSSAVSNVPQSTGISSTDSCPDSNGQEYTEDGQTYQITCGTDYPGNDLQTPHVNSLAECMKACSDYKPDQTIEGGKGCIAAAFGEGNVGGNCYLKYAVTEVNIGNGGFGVGRNTNYQIPQTATTDSLIQYPSSIIGSASHLGSSGSTSITVSRTTGKNTNLGASSLPTPNSLSTTDVGLASLPPDSALATAPSSSLGSSVISSSRTATARSSRRSQATSSTAVVSTPPAPTGSSSLVSVNSPLIASGGSSSGAAGSTLSSSGLGIVTNTPQSAAGTPTVTGGSTEPTVQDPKPDCGAIIPVGNNTRYNDQFAVTYDIRCALGVEGQNADVDAHADTFTDCLQYCSLLKGCIAVTYEDGNNPTNDNSNCYPYYSFMGYSTGGPTGVYSGVAVDGASTGDAASLDLCGADSGSLTQGVYGPDTFSQCYFVGCGQYLTPARELFATDMTTLEGCLTYCSFYNTCIGVDWLGPHTIGDHAQVNCIPIAATGTISAGAPSATQYALSTTCPGT